MATRTVHRTTRILETACAALALLPALAQAQTSAPFQYNIQAQDLGSALTELARQANREVYFSSDLTRGRRAPALSGQMTVEQALDRLLHGSGLTYRIGPSGAIAIVSAEGNGAAAAEKAASLGEAVAGSAAAGNEGANQQAIIVTAQKREQRLFDVPVPETVLKPATLVQSGQTRLQDYFVEVPGLQFTKGNRGETFLSIRGITAGAFSNPTVGVVVDDVPFGSSVANISLGPAPDLDPSDLRSIEVLRGPQGTLYGASSIGGLIKYVTIDPSTDAFAGMLQAGVNAVHNGSEPGYSFRGAINAPLTDDFAIRVSAFHRQDAGYIDDPILGINGINRAHTSGGRVSALWRLADNWKVKLSGLVQDGDLRGAPTVTPSLGGLRQSALAGTGWRNEKLRSLAGTISGDIGPVNLTSITGYNNFNFRDAGDISRFLSGLAESLYGVPGASVVEVGRTSKFSQEVRTDTKLTRALDLLLGAFYDDERSRTVQDIVANSATGARAGEFLHFESPLRYSEFALFGDLTVRFSSRFDVQLGARQSASRQVLSTLESGFFVGGGTVRIPEARSNQSAFTYLFTPRLRLSDSAMIYARFASGYRPGGPNTSRGINGIPASYAPDRTKNYEIGFKGTFANRLISVDASLFHIDWSGIQLNLTEPTTGLAYNSNGSAALSQGAELTLGFHPAPGFTINASGAYTDAHLTRPLPAATGVSGLPGDRLPFSSRFSSTVSADYEFPVGNDTKAFAGAMVNYLGKRQTEFTAVRSDRISLPAFARVYLQAGLRRNGWTLSAFITNLNDSRGILAASVGVYPPYALQYMQPRTIGMNLTKAF